MSISAPTVANRLDSLFQFHAAWQRDGRGPWALRTAPLDWTLLKTQAMAESNLDPDAVSPAGAQGLVQAMRATFDEWIRKEWRGEPPPHVHVSPWDVEDAIQFQADYMAWLLARWQGDVRKAIASYNAGLGRVMKAVTAGGASWEAHLPDETKGYLKKILGA
jgi:membrane-bound lytic murein transglycosylase F